MSPGATRAWSLVIWLLGANFTSAKTRRRSRMFGIRNTGEPLASYVHFSEVPYPEPHVS